MVKISKSWINFSSLSFNHFSRKSCCWQGKPSKNNAQSNSKTEVSLSLLRNNFRKGKVSANSKDWDSYYSMNASEIKHMSNPLIVPQRMWEFKVNTLGMFNHFVFSDYKHPLFCVIALILKWTKLFFVLTYWILLEML